MTISSHCFQPLKVCRLRAVRLDADGAFSSGADNAGVSDALTVVRYSPETLAGEEITQRNGCGDLCVDFRDDDLPRGRGTVDLTFCTLDYEFVELLTGGTILTDGAGNTVGWEPPGADDGAGNGVALEVWGWAWDTDEPKKNDAGATVYTRRAYPKVKFQIGDFEQQNGVTLIPLTGRAHTNSSFGSGPEGDWPAAVSVPGAEFLDEGGLPDATCGYNTLAIAS